MNGRTNSNNNTTGLEIEVPLDPVTNVSASAGNGQVELTWTDPLDKYAATEGEIAESPNPIVSQWDHTRVVRKENTQPTGPNDGVIAVDSTVKNQYLSEPFVDTGLTNGTTYYYGAFACSAAGAWSDGAFVSAVPVAGTPIGELAEGTIITIKENGAPVEFYLSKQGYEPRLNSSDRVLLVRKDVYGPRQWNSSKVNDWGSSTMRSWLNSGYKGLLSANVQTMIGTTTYRYTPGNRNTAVTTRSDSVFLLSLTELGESHIYANTEGSALPIASALKIAYQNGSPTTQWTRSPYTINTGYAWSLGSDDNFASAAFCINSYGSRPCFTLPSTALVDSSNALIES